MMFGSSEARLELDPWMLNREMSLQFKTSHPDGVIAFTGSDSTYLALQLVSGSLVFSAKKSKCISCVVHPRDASILVIVSSRVKSNTIA